MNLNRPAAKINPARVAATRAGLMRVKRARGK
jgi:hypothetical protein